MARGIVAMEVLCRLDYLQAEVVEEEEEEEDG